MKATPEVALQVPVVWVAIFRLDELLRERGVAALIGGTQIALFRLWNDEVLAVGNHDPFSHSNVISRGIVGSRGQSATVASPMYKQVFDLRTGVCLDAPGTRLPVYRVRVIDGQVQVVRPAGATPPPEV